MTDEMVAVAQRGRRLGIVAHGHDLSLETALNVDPVRSHACLLAHHYPRVTNYSRDLPLHPVHSVEMDRGPAHLVFVHWLRNPNALTRARGPHVHDPAHGRTLTFALARLMISLVDVARAVGGPSLAIVGSLLQTAYPNQRMKDDLGLVLPLLLLVLRLPLPLLQPQ